MHAKFYDECSERNSAMDGNKPRLEDIIKKDFKEIE